MTNSSSYSDVDFSINGDVLSLTFDSAYGEISLSLSLNRLEAELSRIISELLERIGENDPNVLTEIAKDSGVPIEEVRKNLQTTILHKTRGRTQNAIDQFIQGKDLHFQGLVEQLIDNLPAGIVLLLTQLALAAIARTVPDVRRALTSELPANTELVDLMNPHFRRSINQLWESRR